MDPILACGRLSLSLDEPRVMGIVNVTADSFSDGGRYLDLSRAIDHGFGGRRREHSRATVSQSAPAAEAGPVC